jgi:hypothetical protein
MVVSMEMNAVDRTPLKTALALLAALEAEVVDACADQSCEVCRPGLELAA